MINTRSIYWRFKDSREGWECGGRVSRENERKDDNQTVDGG